MRKQERDQLIENFNGKQVEALHDLIDSLIDDLKDEALEAEKMEEVRGKKNARKKLKAFKVMLVNYSKEEEKEKPELGDYE